MASSQQIIRSKHGRCSCAKIGDFSVGDRVRIVYAKSFIDLIGNIGTVSYCDSRTVRVIVDDRFYAYPREPIFAPQCLLKIK